MVKNENILETIKLGFIILYGLAFIFGYQMISFVVLMAFILLNRVVDTNHVFIEKIMRFVVGVSLAWIYPSMMLVLIFYLLFEGMKLGLKSLVHQKGRVFQEKQFFSLLMDILLLICVGMSEGSYLLVNCCSVFLVVLLFLSFIVPFLPKISTRKVGLGLLILVCAVGIGAIFPFTKHPEVTETTKKQFEAMSFTQLSSEPEKAKIIGDNGEALEERIRLITQAKEEIILSTFEFDADRSGQQMLAALLDASQRGVKVSILVDGFPYLKAMAQNPYFLALTRQENVEIKQYNALSLLRPWTFMGRMHDKYLIVDDIGYILGGRNTYDFFLGDQEGYKNADWDVYVLGNVSLQQIKAYFTSVWNLEVCENVGEQFWWKFHPAVNKAEDELTQLYQVMRKEHEDGLEWRVDGMVEVDKISLLTNPTHIYAKEPVVFYQMTELMQQAKESVMIHTPYIICNDYMLERLSKIPYSTIMTNSVVNNGNPFGAMDYQMNKPLILETGTQLLEYEQGISYHGKCFTIDRNLTGIGSFNWDMRSAYLDTEVMVVVAGEAFNQQCRQAMKIYEDEALVVLDETSYLLSNGQTKKECSFMQTVQLKFLQLFGSWARFLM